MTQRRALVTGLLLPLAGVILAGAGLWAWLGRAPARPSFLLITIDTLRADHLGCYGYWRPTSPSLDALARGGATFTGAFAPATLSAPSHASLMTSLPAPAHGVLNNTQPLGPEAVTLAEVLGAAGYATGMFVSDRFVSAEYGFGRGFATRERHQVAHHDPGHCHAIDYLPGKPPEAVFAAALAWLDGVAARGPFFLWIHAQQPHGSYDPPPPFDRLFGAPPAGSRHDLGCMDTLDAHADGDIVLGGDELDHAIDLYDGEIAFVDSWIGRLGERLKRLGIDDTTVVVVAADHGEVLFDDPERRRYGHGPYRSDAELRVPLLFAGPLPAAAGTRIAGLVDLTDVAPTLLALAAVHPPAAWQGRSLLPLLADPGRSGREAVYSCTEQTDGTRRLTVRTADRKLLVDRRPEAERVRLFDVGRDPAELADVARDPAYHDDRRRLLAALAGWEAAAQGGRRRLAAAPPSGEARELLRRGGYLAAERRLVRPATSSAVSSAP